MEETVYVVGHRHPDTDSVGSAIAYAHLKNALGDARVQPARAGELNDETRYVLERFSLPTPELLTRATGRRLILVDHNEVAQALDDIEHATILEIWEHHRLGDLDIPQPILFHCEPVGATATLVAEQFFFHDVSPPPGIAGALLAAILSDTLGFASPTTSEKDRAMARRLEAIAGADAAALGRDLMAARGDVAGHSASALIEADFKEFELAGNRIGIGQVEILDASRLLPRKLEFLDELRRVREARHLLQAILMVTDVGKRGSHLWFAGARRDVLERGLGRRLVDDATYLEGCMSRKKQVVPLLERAFVEVAEAGAREK
jgi:manganese-dependent inorganic pyrophosphatase